MASLPPALMSLTEGDAGARRLAVSGVYRLEGDSEAVEQVIFELLGDDDPGVRHAAVELVRRTGMTEPVGAALARSIRDELLPRRASAVDACGRLGGAAVGLLTTLLAEPQDGLRRLAVDALGLTGSKAAGGALTRAIDDPSAAVRAAALEGLARVSPTEAEKLLRTFLRRTDEPASVMLSALLTLESLGARLDPDDLIAHSRDPIRAIPALRLLGRAGAAGPLVNAIATLKGSRLRAALAGLVLAFTEDVGGVARAVTSKPFALEPIEALLSGHDLAAAEGALLVGALRGQVGWFSTIARRPDRARLLSLAHAAARELRHKKPVRALLDEAEAQRDASVAAFLTELAQEVATSRAPPPPPRRHQPALKEHDFARLSRLLLDVAGLQFEPQAAYRLESSLIQRVHEHKLSSFGEYIDLIGADSDVGRAERAVALERVTVHETYFFRETPQLEAFVSLAGILREDCAPRRARIWSAGCSTGEEGWTLAILLRESGHFSADDVEILGTDLATDAVKMANRAIYGERCFRGDMSGPQRRRWFEPTDGGRRVRDELRGNVSFEVSNLHDDDALGRLGKFDVIFCRNVLIYFSREARARLIARFYEHLNPGGLLFLGHSESLLSLETPFAFAPVGRELVYIRRSDAPPLRLGDRLLGATS